MPKLRRDDLCNPLGFRAQYLCWLLLLHVFRLLEGERSGKVTLPRSQQRECKAEREVGRAREGESDVNRGSKEIRIRKEDCRES